MRSTMFVAAGVLMALVSIGCEQESATGPTDNQTFAGTVSANGFKQHAFTASHGGTLTLRLTWTGANDLDLYLTTSACDSYPPGNQPGCPMLARSTGLEGNSETITRTVAEGEQFKAWVDNFSSSSTAYSLSVEIE